MKQRLFFALLVALLCVTVNMFVGLHDIITLIGLILSAALMLPVVLEFQMGSRVFLSNHLKKDGQFYDVIRTPGLFTKVVAFVAAFALAIGLFVSLKGMIISHGLTPSLIIFMFITVSLFSWLMPVKKRNEGAGHSENESEQDAHNETEKALDELEEPAKVYASFVASLIAFVLVVNFTLAAMLSAKDVGVFMATDINLENFSSLAAAASINYSGENEYSRSLINAYILMDYLKLSLVNVLFETFLPGSEKVEYFYAFYFSTFFMNLIKLMPLSIGFVVIIGGVRRHSDSAQALILRLAGSAKPITDKNIKNVRAKIKDFRSRDSYGK